MAKYIYQFQEERGKADLYVSNSDGDTIWEAHYPEFYESNGEMVECSTIFEDGYMSGAEDVEGLGKHLKSLSILSDNDELVSQKEIDEEADEKQLAEELAEELAEVELEESHEPVIQDVLTHYVMAALWSTIGEDDEPLDSNYSIENIDEQTLETMKSDIEKFVLKNKEAIQESGMSDEQLGHDLWLTRNHHGTGFWDRGYDEDIEEQLTDAAHQLKGTDLYVGDDGEIYAMVSYAAGGALESKLKRRMKDSFELPLQVAVYVPSTKNVDVIITKKEMEKRIDDTEKLLSQLFGGYSAVQVEGGFESNDKGLVQEQAVRVVAYGAKENEQGIPFEKSFENLINQVKSWCKEWSQQSIGLEFENDLFYVNAETKFELGGYMADGGRAKNYFGERYRVGDVYFNHRRDDLFIITKSKPTYISVKYLDGFIDGFTKEEVEELNESQELNYIGTNKDLTDEYRFDLRPTKVVDEDEHRNVEYGGYMAKGGRSKANKKYTHFAIRKSDNKILTGWDYKGLENDEIKHWSKLDMTDMDFKTPEYKVVGKQYLVKQGIDPYDFANWRGSNEFELGGYMADGGELDSDLVAYTIPDWAVSSLINGDDSGLEEHDIEKLEKFIEKTIAVYGNANFMLSDEEEFDLGFTRWNDIDNMGSDCSLLYLRPTKVVDEDEHRNVEFGGYMARGGKTYEYETYHDTLSSALEDVDKYVESKGFKFVDDAYFPDITYGGIPYGQTARLTRAIQKEGRNKQDVIIVNIYRMDSGRYELTVYTSYEDGGGVDDDSFEDGVASKKFDYESFLKHVYPDTKKLMSSHGLIINNDYEVSDGGTNYYVGHLMFEGEDGVASKFAITYFDAREALIGSMSYDLDKRILSIDFPDWQVNDSVYYDYESYADGGITESIIQKVLNGEIDSDDAAVEIDESGIEVTNELYDELREAEKIFRNKGRGLQVGDTVIVKGKNGNIDFEANYRGEMPDGKLVVVTKGGMQIAVSKDDLLSKYEDGGYMAKGSMTDDLKKSKYIIKKDTYRDFSTLYVSENDNVQFKKEDSDFLVRYVSSHSYLNKDFWKLGLKEMADTNIAGVYGYTKDKNYGLLKLNENEFEKLLNVLDNSFRIEGKSQRDFYMDRKKYMEDGGEINWGEDLGGGFHVGTDVYITDSKSLFKGSTGFVSVSVGKDLLVTISKDGNERNIVVSKKGVEKLDAPEYAEGGSVDIKKSVNDFVETLNSKYSDSYLFTVTFASKYAKISHQPVIKGEVVTGKAVWGFIVLENDSAKGYFVGDLLKAASASAPAKGARGNILNGTAQYDKYSPQYGKGWRAEGGTFEEGVKAIEKKLVGTKVKPKYQKEYGKTYDKGEAHEAASRIKGSMRAMELAKKYSKKK